MQLAKIAMGVNPSNLLSVYIVDRLPYLQESIAESAPFDPCLSGNRPAVTIANVFGQRLAR